MPDAPGGPNAHGLMYHEVIKGSDDGVPPRLGPGPYNVSWRAFLEHLDRLEEIASAPTVLEEVSTGDPGRPRWALTFDDGGSSALPVGEELCRRGWRGYFFITTDRIGREGFLSAAAIRELDAMGHVIGSHSSTHPVRIASLPAAALRHEWAASAGELASLLEKRIRTASVPGGYYADGVAVAAAEAGIETLFTSYPVRTTRTVAGCLLVGRYVIRSRTSALAAAHAAAGDPRPWVRQYLAWKARGVAKRVGGERYDSVRRRLVVGVRQR